MAILKDIWRVGVARAPAARLLTEPGALDATEIVWLPEEGSMRFIADPFGLWRDGQLFVFVEGYDYRDRRGVIDVITLSADLKVMARAPALREPWHLSYPFVFEADGETWMLPEAFRSGRLTLYRAEAFPERWTPAAVIELDAVAIDATPLFHDGLWWLFYAPAGSKADKVSALHVAWAERLTGPWTPHPGNPVRYDAASSRAGGRPLLVDGKVVLPVQDCSRTYGGAIRPLVVTTLAPGRFEAEAGPAILPPRSFGHWQEGLHTVSAAGDVTLIDAKRHWVSPLSLGLDLKRFARARWAKV